MWTPCTLSTFVLCLSHDAFKTLSPTRQRLNYYSYKLYTYVSICENMPLPLLIHLPSTFHCCITHSLFRLKVLWGKSKYYLSGADWWGKEPKDATASPQTAWGKDLVCSSLAAENNSHFPYLTLLFYMSVWSVLMMEIWHQKVNTYSYSFFLKHFLFEGKSI